MSPDPLPYFEGPPEEGALARFGGLVADAKRAGFVSESASDFTAADLEELEARALELARVDPASFIHYVFGWPLQACHVEWQDFLADNRRAVLWAPVEHGKTSQVSIARPLFELGRDPNLRVALISNTEGQAAKCLSVVKQQIELNPRLHRVFPELRRETRPGRRALWHDTAVVVRREDLDNKDPSIQALGVYTSIVGARIDLAILDDVLDFENTLHETGRRRTIQWFDSSVSSRVTAFGRIWCIGTAWHREDLMEVLGKRPGWSTRRYDAWESALWPELVKVAGKWVGWPRERLEEKRRSMPALEFNRQFRNKTQSGASVTFSAELVETCYTGDAWDPEPTPEQQFYVGVDLNVSRKKGAAETCFFAGELLPTGARRVQVIVAEVMDLQDIVWWFYRLEARLHPVLFLVENNAAQDYVRQLFTPTLLSFLESSRGLPENALMAYAPRVEGFHTGSNKADPELGIRGMTLEFEERRWRIPRSPETRRWVEQLVDFDPLAHPGDILMASWFFHSACLKYRPRRVRAESLGSGEKSERREREDAGDRRIRLT